jgi:hypothetical protein
VHIPERSQGRRTLLLDHVTAKIHLSARELPGSFALLRILLDACPYGTMLLDQDRRLVFANRAFAELCGFPDSADMLGMRPGEALQCLHSTESPDGCGASDFCTECGGLASMQSALKGIRQSRDCRMVRRVGNLEDYLDLVVSASPCSIDGKPYLFCTVLDVSGEKRRQVLERLFFHDVLDTAAAVQGLATVLGATVPPGKASHCADLISTAAARLVNEVRSQRELVAAERGELSVGQGLVECREFLVRLAAEYRTHDFARGRSIEVDRNTEQASIVTDPELLHRIAANMVKNALEASEPGEMVTMGCRAFAGGVELWVHNRAVMPREVQLQLFYRSFSTKGSGRGLGTYSIKLFTERYLGGTVTFRSQEPEGTTFYVRLPRTLPQSTTTTV